MGHSDVKATVIHSDVLQEIACGGCYIVRIFVPKLAAYTAVDTDLKLGPHLFRINLIIVMRLVRGVSGDE